MGEKGGSGTVLKRSRRILIIVMAASLASVYGFTDMKGSYYQVIRSALGVTDAQLGVVWSAFGVTALASYLLGGFLADRFSPLAIIRVALLGSAALHLGFSFLPPYPVQILLSGLMGIAAVLAFFPASTKLLTALGSDGDSGAVFGIYYGLGGILSFLFSLFAARLYAVTLDGTRAFVLLMRIYAIMSLTCFGLLCRVSLKNLALPKQQPVEWKEVLPVLRSKKVWLVSSVIFGGYLVFRGLTYVTPYLTAVYGMPDEAAVQFSVLRNGLLLPAVCMAFGLWSRKKGSTAWVIRQGFLLLALTCILMAGNDRLRGNLPGALLLTTAFVGLGAGIKNISMSLIPEAGIPYPIRGTAIGIISVIGYSPDAFLYPVIGRQVERMGGAAYTLFFLLCASISLAGFWLCRCIARET